ncbi:MAG: rhodanese-like domain-containing protein [Pseudomonadota bacterium]
MAQFFEFVGNHSLLVGTFVLLLVLFIRNEMSRGGRSVTAQQLVDLVNREGAVVVDVRDGKEFATGHIVGALNIPHANIESRLGELEKFKDKTLVLACGMGQHSGAAGTVLRKNGFADVARLAGGIAEWRNQNLPVVKGKAAKGGKGKAAKS